MYVSTQCCYWEFLCPFDPTLWCLNFFLSFLKSFSIFSVSLIFWYFTMTRLTVSLFFFHYSGSWVATFFFICVFIFDCWAFISGRLFSSCGKQGPRSSFCVPASHCGACLFAEHRLQTCNSQASERRLKSYGAWA